MPAPSPHVRPAARPHDDSDDWSLDREDIARYRELLKKRPSPEIQQSGMEISSGGAKRSVKRLVAYVLLLSAVAGIFTVMFFQFTSNLRVALAVVMAMLIYMLVTARMAEGKFDV